MVTCVNHSLVDIESYLESHWDEIKQGYDYKVLKMIGFRAEKIAQW